MFWHLSDILDFQAVQDDDSGSDGDGPQLERMDVDQTELDPALQDFVPKLKTYLHCQLLSLDDPDAQFSTEDLINVVIEKDLLYTHATMKVNYMTYDVRRDQDMINTRTRRFFLVHAQDLVDSHRYWYGEIIGIFHAYVLLADLPGKAKRVEFLWVRWFQRDMTHRCGMKAKHFPRIRYMPHESVDAFGFLNPQDVVRGVSPSSRLSLWTDYGVPSQICGSS
ncbi:hypothetical protein MIND_01144600 [Mycena indigotica]|uniref:Uncharacterized protein n=1 Tax=Mycena indigotica TaxID=2126181 RepID=A0A8H6S762_9AGAR|nr:uncharacterized protein MIND_01144600 [Mycena indigotica]KAF7293647.1 hypothetical protein MIND_01144600 [Mycena indigotica]